MQLIAGNHKFAVNEGTLQIHRQAEFTQFNTEKWTKNTWAVSGYLIPPDGSTDLIGDLTKAIQSLEGGFVDHGIDVALVNNDGSPTAYRAYNSLTIGGTRITVKPSYPVGTGAEYATMRHYNIVVEFDAIPSGLGGATVVEWQESLNFRGGGPKIIWLEPLNGPPVPQVVKQQTTFKATQSGRAVGLYTPVIPPPPYWAPFLHTDMSDLGAQSSQSMGATKTLIYYPIYWHYEFESDIPLFAIPAPNP